MLPSNVRMVGSLWHTVLALAIVLATSLVGTWVAVVRVSRLAPAAALIEVSAGRSVRPLRLAAGFVLVVAGGCLSVVLARLAPKQTDNAAVFIFLAECVGVGLLGPLLLATVVRLLRLVFRAGLLRVAVDDLATMARQLAGAIVPLTLAVGFAGIKLAAHTSAPPGTKLGAADDTWTDVWGTSIFCGFATIAAVNCVVIVVAGRRRSLAAMQLAGASRRSLMGIAAVQVAIVTVLAIALSSAIVMLTLGPVLQQAAGDWRPHVPIPAIAGIATAVGLVVGAAMLAPVARFTRASPIQWAGTTL